MKKSIILLFLLISIAVESLFPQDQKIIISPTYAAKKSNAIHPIEFKEIKRPKIAVVFSGGGARGFADIGILQVLEKKNIPIDYIVGTSIGGVIGGLYASGYTTEELAELADTTDWAYVLSLTDASDRRDLYLSQKQTADKKQLTVRFNGLNPIIPSAISTGQRLASFINELTLQSLYHPVRNFDDLKIPFRCVSTDLVSGKMIVFEKGNISEALRASISIPLLYNPLKIDSLELIDGGLMSNIPVEVAQSLGADIIIAVNTTSVLRTAEQMNNPWEVADQIVNIMAQEKNKESLRKATIVLTPDLGAYPASDFAHIPFVIQQGIYATQSKIAEIKDSIRESHKRTLLDSSPLQTFSSRIDTITTQFMNDVDTESSGIVQTLRADSIVSVPDIKEILGSVYSTGWYRDVHAELNFGDSLTDLSIIAVPNPVLRTITLTGNDLIPTENILPILDTLTDKPMNYPMLRKAFEDILILYRDKGYSLARIQNVDFDSQSGTLRVEINEGIIYKIYLKGKRKSRDWVIWRELHFRDGDVFTLSKAQNAVTNLYGTNLFNQVLIDVGYEDNLPIVDIQLDEKPSDVARVGIRIDNERNVQPSIEFRNENLLGTATELGISFAGGLRNRKYDGEFKANRIFNTYFTFHMNGYYDLRDINTYTGDPNIVSDTRFARIKIGEYRQITYGALFSLGQQVERLGTVNIDYRLESDEVKFLSGTGYSKQQFTLQSLRLSSVIDSRDRYPFPTTGSLTNFYWEIATSSFKGFVGDVGYSKIFFAYESNFSYHRSTLRPKIVVGFGDKTLPLTKQFLLGGEDSFYGVKEDDARGRQIFVVSMEYSALLPFSLIWDTYFKARYDFGDIWPQREDIRLKDLHHGIGFGLSLDTPIGPASISIGRSFYIRSDLLNQPVTLGPIVTYLSWGFPIL